MLLQLVNKITSYLGNTSDGHTSGKSEKEHIKCVDPCEFIETIEAESDEDNFAKSQLDLYGNTEDKQLIQEERYFRILENFSEKGAQLFSSVVSIVGNTGSIIIGEASEKIKNIGVINKFNEEQEKFIREKAITINTHFPPWVGCANENIVKEECLSLSNDKRNFVKSPPTGVDFDFSYSKSYPVALAMLKEDPNLERMRYDLVPKVVKEETFWKNYFYRIGLVMKANESLLPGYESSPEKGFSTCREKEDDYSDEQDKLELEEDGYIFDIEADISETELLSLDSVVESNENV